MTKDDDDVAAQRLNAFIEVWVNDPAYQAELGKEVDGQILPKKFEKKKMSELRQRIKGDIGFVDNGAYKRILVACSYMTEDKVGQQHFYNLIYNAAEIIFQDQSNPDLGENPLDTKDWINTDGIKDANATWKMPDVGDQGHTEVKKIDWALFVSLVNSTSKVMRSIILFGINNFSSMNLINFADW